MASPVLGPRRATSSSSCTRGAARRAGVDRPRGRARRGRGGRDAVSRVGFVMHPRRAAAVDTAMWLDRLLSSEGVETVRLPDDGHRPPDGADGLDLVVSVGGDGTFLRAAFCQLGRRLPGPGCQGRPTRVPHRGGARGRTGPDPERPARRGDDRGATRRSRPSRWTGADFAPQWGLNEIMVEKHARHRLVRLAVHVDGDLRDDVLGRRRDRGHADRVDRLLVLGAGADRESPAWIPSCSRPSPPHMVFDRSFVLDAGSQVVPRGGRGGERPALGRRTPEHRASGGRDRCGSARRPRPARLVRREDAPAFLSLVREKFDLPGERPPPTPARRCRGAGLGCARAP